MTRHVVRVRCSVELLGQLIGLPAGQRVIQLIPQDAHDVWTNTVQLMIEGEGLPDVHEGEIPRLAECEVHQNANGCPEAAVVLR